MSTDDHLDRLRAEFTRFTDTLLEHGRPLIHDLAERGDPLLRRLAETPTAHDEPGATCDWCPVCAGIAMLRGRRPELAARLAGQFGDLLATLRGAVDETPPPAPDDPVQHITVERE